MPSGFIKNINGRQTLEYPTIEEISGLSDALAESQSAEIDSNASIGQPVYIKNSGHLGLAQASSAASARVVGLILADAQSATSADYSSIGVIERSDWTAITGSLLLSVGSTYYLSPNSAGMLTTTAPQNSGLFVVAIGIASTDQKLSLDIQPPILL
jgi:hypothetical protein